MKIKSILLSVMAIGLGIIFWGTVAQAQEDIGTVLNDAPQGITIDNYFTEGQGFKNSATKATTPYGKDQAIQLTDAGDQLGTIWTSNGAEMNLGEDETASMWLYFGNGNDSAGDGMAFVMQNDKRGLSATSTKADGTPDTGETLGVWGSDQRTDYTQKPDLSAVAKSAIQNSWALEFDTFGQNRLTDVANLKKGIASQFDTDVPSGYPHIAANYPGLVKSYGIGETDDTETTTTPATYFPIYIPGNSVTTTTPYYYVKTNHEGLLHKRNSFLSSGTWHHLTLKWTAPTAGTTLGTMKYTFDDKNQKTGATISQADGATSNQVQVDTSNFQLGADKKIRWGFTGSTGDSFENNLVVFEEVPGLVDADVTANLVDNSQANMTIDDASDKVYTGDQMTLKYHLNYKGGRDSWQSIKNKLNLPADIAYDSAKVTYDDGKFADGKTSETIPVDSSDTTGQSVSETLARNLSKNTSAGETDGATITLTGKASSKTATASTPDKVTSKTSSFEGSNAITQATVSGFQVAPGGDGTSVMTMALTGPEKNITANSNNQKGSESQTSAADVTVSGKITYKKVDGTPVTDKTLTLQPRLNGDSLQTSTVTDSDKDGVYDFSYTIPSTSLIAGSTGNVLDLFATDTSTHLSAANNLEYTVTLKDGTKSISANTLSSFNADDPQKMTGSAMRLTPDSNWSVKVYDSMGTGDQWTLQASAGPLMSKLRGVTLDGELKYLDGNGNEETFAQGATVNIASHTTTSDDDVVDVAKSWDQNHGIVLDVNGGAVQGYYATRIQWTFGNVINVS